MAARSFAYSQDVYLQDLCLRFLAMADFQNRTNVVAKLSFTDSESVVGLS
jgi:hypothetical protein